MIRALARWLVSRHELNKALREQDEELRVAHVQYLEVCLAGHRKDKRIRELEDQNVRMIFHTDMAAWEKEMGSKT